MSDERETQGEEVVPEGFIVLHENGVKKRVRASAIVEVEDRGDESFYSLQGDAQNTGRCADESPAEIAALISAAQGGTGGEAEAVLAWLNGAEGSEVRQVWVEDRPGENHFAMISGKARKRNGTWPMGNGTTFLDAIAAAEAERS